ncbi:MAG: restriction endonuclease subunit S [Flavobacteriales bacterium]|nr:restriction endonuclease subunit S [Flavobacteriales bacterium]
MTERWVDFELHEIAAPQRNALVGGPFGSNLTTRDFVGAGVPVIQGKNMQARYIGGDFVFVSNDKADELAANWARPGDVIFTQRGTLGQVALVPDGAYPVYITSQSQMKLTPNLELADPLFLYYLFRSPEQQQYVFTNAIRVGVPHTNLGILKRTPVSLPPLETQRSIASILGALDDKIELNRRMNGTLEALAQAVFKEWFVEGGRRSFSEGGKAEEGWKTMMLDEVAYYRNGLALQKFRPKDGEEALPAVKIAQMRTGLPDSGEWASPSIDPECILDDGDVVFSWSGSLMAILWCGGKAALNQHLFKVTSDKFPKWFYYLWTQHYMPEFQGIASNKATTMGHINRNHLKVPVPIPPFELLKRGDEVIAPLLDRMVANNLETRTLTALRDTLLPKLMRGEVRVKAAHKTVA